MMNDNMGDLLGRAEREVEANMARWERARSKQLLKAFEAGARKHMVMIWLQDSRQGMTTRIYLDPVLMNLIGETAGREAEQVLKKNICSICAMASEEIIRAIAQETGMEIEIRTEAVGEEEV
ncbi:MAG: hypothetical protein IJD13_07650 [Oscillospiraceae bacterium]|nr:hypothetical protein [Oscillospiraceae bacterium]